MGGAALDEPQDLTRLRVYRPAAPAGGLLFFGDVGGNLYALDSATGQKLWGEALDGAIAEGVITYVANGAQKVAVAAGFTHPEWPTIISRKDCGTGARRRSDRKPWPAASMNFQEADVHHRQLRVNRSP